MTYIIAVLGFVLLSVALWDAFEVIISPRRVTRPFRFTRGFYRSSWWLWSAVARSIADENRRETYLGIFGPLSLVMLLGVWATAIVVGFAMMHWGLESPLNVAPGIAPFSTYLYMSGTTFFTLGLGDVTPMGAPGTGAGRVRSWDGFWLPCGRHLVPAGYPLSGIFRPRGEHFTPRCTCRLAADCRRAITEARERHAGARAVAL